LQKEYCNFGYGYFLISKWLVMFKGKFDSRFEFLISFNFEFRCVNFAFNFFPNCWIMSYLKLGGLLNLDFYSYFHTPHLIVPTPLYSYLSCKINSLNLATVVCVCLSPHSTRGKRPQAAGRPLPLTGRPPQSVQRAHLILATRIN
jgi:hypothetical protein